MLLPILKYGAPELKRVSSPVDFFNGELERMVRNMTETMYGAPGIGLAAVQVGIDLRLTTVDLSVGDDENQFMVICNPEVVSTEGEQKGEEGCLSIPEFSEAVIRPQRMIVKARNIHGDEIRINAEGLLARCLCHEIDHMNGVLFIDHLSALKRNLIRNRIRKLARSGEW